MRITIILALSILLLFTSCTISFAKEVDIGYSKIHPASPFYFLKTIREDLELKLALTSHVRQLRILEFAFRRLREARTLISINNYPTSSEQDLIPPTLERYISNLNSLPDQNLKDEEVLTKIKDSLIIHLHMLQQMYDQVSNLRVKMAIRSAMNKIIQRADVPDSAKRPICAFFAKEVSSSALNQTEQIVLKNRAQDCFKKLTVDKSSRNF